MLVFMGCSLSWHAVPVDSDIWQEQCTPFGERKTKVSGTASTALARKFAMMQTELLLQQHEMSCTSNWIIRTMAKDGRNALTILKVDFFAAIKSRCIQVYIAIHITDDSIPNKCQRTTRYAMAATAHRSPRNIVRCIMFVSALIMSWTPWQIHWCNLQLRIGSDYWCCFASRS